MKTLLEFEKPIAELEDKLIEMRKLALDNNVDVTATVASLTEKILELKKETFSNLTRWQRVQLSRHPNRPYTLDYINAICGDTFLELFGDRAFKDDKAMIGGLGKIEWYKNGTFTNTSDDDQAYNYGNISNTFYLGSVQSETYKYNGDIAIVRQYNRKLQASEILQNFNAHKSRFGL